MKAIEFIGPSGIGKSTFLRELKKRRTDLIWIDKGEAKEKIKEHIISKTEKFVSDLFYVLSRGRIGSRELSRLNKTVNNIKEGNNTNDLIFQVFLLSIGRTNMPAGDKLKMIDYYCSIYNDMIDLDNVLDNNQLILFDEGLLHNNNFPILNSDILQYVGFLDAPLFPKAIIALCADEKTYIERIHKRFEQNSNRNLNFLNMNMSDKDIKKHVQESIEKHKSKVMVCRSLGVDIIEIEAFFNKNNFEKVENFIQNLNNKN